MINGPTIKDRSGRVVSHLKRGSIGIRRNSEGWYWDWSESESDSEEEVIDSHNGDQISLKSFTALY